jgi:hypothetical protein
MIPLRWPSEKPTREDADKSGDIIIFESHGVFAYCSWDDDLSNDVLAWLPGRLPEGILPREPSQEEKWREEFTKQMASSFDVKQNGDGSFAHRFTDAAWQGFLAAKKGGAE